MKESSQTLCFLGIALATVLLAVFTYPSDEVFDVQQLVGKTLDDKFDIEQAKSLRVVRFNEDSASLSEFEVAEADGIWSIPSKDGYPADAAQQMARATLAVMDREILRVVSQDASKHIEYGVVAPNSELDIDASGVGTLVEVQDDSGEMLVNMIIGKEIKDAPGQHYARRVTQDAVYAIEIDPSDLSTSFADWIESDLLSLEGIDITSIQIKDYTAELRPQGFSIGVVLEQKANMKVAYDDETMAWKPEVFEELSKDSNEFVPFEIGKDQQLNGEALDGLKKALGDLLIVDVEKKPVGLSDALKQGGNFTEDNDSAIDLIQHGFAPTSDAKGEVSILSTEGEAICTLKDGIEYVLRFGNLQTSSVEDSDATDESEGGINRYLFVMVRHNPSVIEQPVLEEVPELPEGTDEGMTNDESDIDEADAGEDESTEEETTEEDSDEDEGSTSGDEEDAESEEAEEDEVLEETKELIATRAAIIRRNRQLTDEYEDRIAQAEERVRQLNDRFGDWYYVISNDVFKKIRLGRDELIIDKPAEEEAAVEADPNASQFGSPGAAIPGLPSIGQ